MTFTDSPQINCFLYGKEDRLFLIKRDLSWVDIVEHLEVSIGKLSTSVKYDENVISCRNSS